MNNIVFGGKCYQKGGKTNVLRKKPEILFGEIKDIENDLCNPVRVLGYKDIDGYKLPIGVRPNTLKATDVEFWNYGYFFRTKEVSKDVLWRSAKAHHKYFNNWDWGKDPEEALKIFLDAAIRRWKMASNMYDIDKQPEYMRNKLKNLKEEQFGIS